MCTVDTLAINVKPKERCCGKCTCLYLCICVGVSTSAGSSESDLPIAISRSESIPELVPMLEWI